MSKVGAGALVGAWAGDAAAKNQARVQAAARPHSGLGEGYPMDRTRSSALLKVKPSPKSERVFLYFGDVTEEDLARAASAQSKAEVKRLLQDCMRIDQAEGFRTEILADMHYHNYTFCMSHDFTPAKTSTFLSIMKLVLEEGIKRRLEVDSAFDVFKEWLLKHSVERPPWSVGIFSFEDVRNITEYVHSTFFRHYRLYMYAFMTQRNLSFRMDDFGGAVAPVAHRALPMRAEDEQEEPKAVPSEAELAEAELRRLQKRDGISEGRAALIKRKVELGCARLKETFEPRLREQELREQELLQQEQELA